MLRERNEAVNSKDGCEREVEVARRGVKLGDGSLTRSSGNVKDYGLSKHGILSREAKVRLRELPYVTFAHSRDLHLHSVVY